MLSHPQTMAGIVIFHPDDANLLRLVAVLAPDVREIVIYANSPFDAGREARLGAAAGATPLSVVRPDGNRGLGEAYNALVAHAAGRGDTFLFILDQDSLPAPGTVPRLAAIHARLDAAGERPAIVGPRPSDRTGTPMKAPPRRGLPAGDGVSRVEFVISSGSLLHCAAARSVGPFRSDFFIDAIDIEWCMRANHRGFSIWIADEIRMAHELGRGLIRLPLGLLLTDQPPRRLYTYLRNQLAMLRLAHVPWRHKVQTLTALPLRIAVYLVHNRFSRETRAAIRNGVTDGARARLGAPDGAFRTLFARKAGRAQKAGGA